MSEQTPARYGIDPYLDWVAKEGLPVTEDYGIDLFTVETKKKHSGETIRPRTIEPMGPA